MSFYIQKMWYYGYTHTDQDRFVWYCIHTNIVVTDRATLFNLLIGLNGYTISSGILSSDLNGTEIVSVPLESDEIMEIGYIHGSDRPIGHISQRYLTHLRTYIERYRALI